MAFPEGLYYTEEHEWISLEGDVATVGITDYAQEKLGDIVFIELPEVGTDAASGDTLASIESVKAASEIYAPVAGKISEVNEELNDAPGTVNKDPYGDGWIARLSGVTASEVEDLMDASTYEENVVAGEED
ncbi:MAG: glycine cleavage system protein GcvH [Planctomycetota bacterium]